MNIPRERHGRSPVAGTFGICNIPQGIALRDAVSLARSLGVTVYQPRSTGEFLFRYPGLPSVRVNARRHDSSRQLVRLLRLAAQAARRAA